MQEQIPQQKPDQETTWGARGILFRGGLMGIAEVVPGVSGGTMAFITGIYQTLVDALASFGPRSFALLRDPVAFYTHHNLRFLLLLAAGMLGGILLFAQLMRFLLEHYQPVVWAFFSGVIAMSAWVIGRERHSTTLAIWAPVGLLAGLALLWIPQAAGEPSYLSLFVGGMVAVCAWLLPAVSGSYVLLTLGLYEPVIEAVASFDLKVVIVLGLGCATGLLAFTRVLAWLLHHHSQTLLSFLTGFMLGSLPKLWPWQAQTDQGSVGVDHLLSPAAFEVSGAGPAYLVFVVLFFLVGGLVLWYLSRLGK